MGLDVVELMIEFEQHFQVKIEDREAEQACTIQDIVNLICLKRNITAQHCLIFNDFSCFIKSELKLLYPNIELLDVTGNVLDFINMRDQKEVDCIAQHYISNICN